MAKKISRHRQKTEEEKWWHQTRIESNGYTGTKDTETQAAVVRSLYKRMNNSRLPAKAIRLQEVGGDKIRGGLTTSMRIYSTEDMIMRQAAERVKDRKQLKKCVHSAPLSATYGWRRMGQKKERIKDEKCFIMELRQPQYSITYKPITPPTLYADALFVVSYAFIIELMGCGL